MGKEFFELLNGVRGNTAEHIAEPGKRIDLVDCARAHETAQNRHGPAAAIAAEKGPFRAVPQPSV